MPDINFDEALLRARMTERLKRFFNAGVELGYFKVTGIDPADGEAIYRHTEKWDAGWEAATHEIASLLGEKDDNCPWCGGEA